MCLHLLAEGNHVGSSHFARSVLLGIIATAFPVFAETAIFQTAVIHKSDDSSRKADVLPEPLTRQPPQSVISESIVIMDCSHCMYYLYPPTRQARITIAQWAAYDLLDAIPDGLPTAVMVLKNEVETVRALHPLAWSDKTELRR